MKRLIGLLVAVIIYQASYGQTITSTQAGPWNQSSTWAGGTIPTAANSTAINVNHNINIPSPYTATVDQVTVAPGITLTIDSGGELDLQNSGSTDLTLTDDLFVLGIGSFLVVNGDFINNSVASIYMGDFSLSTINFGSGSRYDHAHNGGNIPSTGVTWNSNSTCEISGSTSSAPGGFGQTFDNFTWNATGQTASLTLALTSSTILGDFTISSTGSSFIYLASSAGTMDVNGDFTVSGSSRFFGSATASVTYDIEGDFSFSSSAGFSLLIVQTGTVNLNVGGNFSATSGVLRAYALNTATVNLTFDGSSTQTFNVTDGTLFTTHDYNYTVSNNAIVDAGTSAFVGGGSLTIGSTGTLMVGSTDGSGAIQTGTLAGNIRVGGTRTYNGGATIVYNNIDDIPQSIGDGLPSDINLTIDNSGGVSLSADTTIPSTGRTLTLADGNLNIGANILTIDGNVVSSGGTLSGGISSDLIIGGTGNLSLGFTSGARELHDFNITRNGTITITSDLTTHSTGTMTLASVSALDFSSQTLTINGVFTNTGGAFDNNSSSALIIGGGAVSFGTANFNSSNLGTFTLNRVGLNVASASSLTIGNALNLTVGTLSGAGAVTMGTGSTITRTGNGTYSKATPAATTTYNVSYTGPDLTTGNELTADTGDLNNLTVSSSGTVTLNSGITVNGTLALSGGTFAAGSNAIDMKGNFVSGSSSILTSSAITFSGTTSISGGVTPIFNNITVTGTLTPTSTLNINGNLLNNGTLNSGSGTVNFGGTTAISGSSTSSFNNINVTGTLTAPSGTMNVAGTFTNSGTFTHNSGTVNFNGATTFSGTTPSFHSMSIAGSSSLTAPTTINIAGNFTNSGTFNNSNGTVVFNGSSGQQFVSGTTTFENLTLNTNGNMNNNANVSIEGTLTLGTSTIFDADGSGSGVFTIVSNSSGTARVAALTGSAAVNGNVRFQRYFDGAGDVWRNFGVAVNGATVSNITGSGFTINGNDLARYDETVTGDVDQGWELQSSFGTSLSSTEGYSMWTRTAQMTNTVEFTGTLNQGTINYSLTNTDGMTGDPSTDDGWHLLNNPYPSQIDWASGSWTKTNITGTVYVWDTDNGGGTYLTHNGTTGTFSGRISSGQAFWVQSNASSPALSAVEAVKTSGTATFERSEGLSNHLRISLVQGASVDQAIIHFREDATDNLDMINDGIKLSNNIFNLSSLAYTGESLVINSMGPISCSKSIALNIDNINAGAYYLSFTDLSTFNEGTTIQLVDNYLSSTVVLEEGGIYSFDVSSDEASYGSDRFELIFNQPYMLEAQAQDGSNCGKGQVTIMASGTPSGGTYKWYVSIDATEPITGETSSNYVTPELETTTTYYVAVVNADGCESLARVPVIAVIDELPPVPDITVDGNVLISSSKTGNQWYKDGIAIDGAIENQYEVTESGIYTVEVSNDKCSSVSDQRVMEITAIASNVNNEDDIRIYPNPVSDGPLNVNILGKQGKYDNVSIIDSAGKLIKTVKLNGNEFEINMNNFGKGIYYLLFKGNDGATATYKIFKQ